jgi:putative spermidine/putrescine transport system ATP-binding protein/spermidine/putrescine transport system ATP-binding protein
VASFIGHCNLLPARIVEDGRAALIGNGLRLAIEPAGARAGSAVAIRPEHVAIGAPAGANRMQGRLDRAVYLGAATQLHLDIGGIALLAEVPSAVARGLAPGESVALSIDPRNVRVLP